MIKKHEIILSVALSIGMVALIIIVGVVTWNRVNYCYDNPTSESPMNCSQLHDDAAQGKVDGKEKWNWVDKYLGWIIFIIVLAGVLAFLMYWQPFVYGGGFK